jgi:predicted RNA binding protein YcfA (HicA-like mRNA interferase family)
LGFVRFRQEGSHAFFPHTDGRTTVIPNPPGDAIDRALLSKIIKKDLGIDRDAFPRSL